MLDCDEFITPLIPEQKNIHYYIKEMFRDNSVGCATLQWVDLHCELDLAAFSQLKDGNVTKTLKSIHKIRRHEGKSVYKVSAILMSSVHVARLLLPSFKHKYVNGEALYIAHIKKNFIS